MFEVQVKEQAARVTRQRPIQPQATQKELKWEDSNMSIIASSDEPRLIR